MRIVVQRVSSARVTIDKRVTGHIDQGLLIYLGIESADNADDGLWLADKIARLRIFEDESGRMNRSLLDIASADGPAPVPLGPFVLLVSQFTLHASTAKGNRPSFHAAARPEHARPLYELFIGQLAVALGGPDRVATGEFGASMQVASVNDGPVTLIIDSKSRA